MQIDGRVLQLVFTTQRTLVRTRRTGIIDQPIALTLTVGYIPFQVSLFLGGQLAVTGFVNISGRVILANSELLVRTLDTLLNRATG